MEFFESIKSFGFLIYMSIHSLLVALKVKMPFLKYIITGLPFIILFCIMCYEANKFESQILKNVEKHNNFIKIALDNGYFKIDNKTANVYSSDTIRSYVAITIDALFSTAIHLNNKDSFHFITYQDLPNNSIRMTQSLKDISYYQNQGKKQHQYSWREKKQALLEAILNNKNNSMKSYYLTDLFFENTEENVAQHEVMNQFMQKFSNLSVEKLERLNAKQGLYFIFKKHSFLFGETYYMFYVYCNQDDRIEKLNENIFELQYIKFKNKLNIYDINLRFVFEKYLES